ncbi:unnamed protein product [Eruca vesicaria subsp. sativa]|uniref:RIN4 pathogenic type III effector avirulence factor Avr cleavage site domain-containing protein n=1 Tax=Eruca vesicaria subsp. sativa TaxID=29727 RepID=A0ABC8KUX9_ERUVS|nr:unnamed protein product [Eruca vesicaria subsp. sativa]
MDYEYGIGEYYRRGHVPAFGSWDWNDAVPFTQCFETATTTTTQQHQQQQPSFLHYAPYTQDRDLYLAGDLYDNHHLVAAPAVILVPRRRAKVGQEPKKASSKEQHKFKTEARESDAPISCPTPVVKRRTKPVDEDLYRISPTLLTVKSTKKRGGGFGCISRCFLPTRVL